MQLNHGRHGAALNLSAASLACLSFLALGCSDAADSPGSTGGGGDDVTFGFDTAAETSGECSGGCDDSDACTDDLCANGACTHVNNKAPCDDGDACTGGDQCDAGACKPGGQDLCAETVSTDAVDGGATEGPDLKPGDLLINEVMYNPYGAGDVADTDGEWFEIRNMTAADIDLTGVTIRDELQDKYNILGGKTTIPANGFFVLGRGDDPAKNGGVTVDHVYGAAISLGNDTDALFIVSNSVVVDKVIWNTQAGWPKVNGAAMSLSPGAANDAANDTPEAWCAAETVMASGDKGTPGKANDACLAADKDKDGWADDIDNCPGVPNPTQYDGNNNGVGDDCEGGPPNCSDATLDADEECDDGNKNSGDGCTKYCQIETAVAAGAVIISEFLPNPATVVDDLGEWIEVYNTTDAAITLNGARLTIGTTNPFVEFIDSPDKVVVPAKGYALFATNGDAATNGGLPVATWLYAKLKLSSKNAVLGLWYGETQIDAVAYGPGWPLFWGKSMALDPEAHDATLNDDAANWCKGQSVYGDGDYGSPGGANPSCEGVDQDDDKDGIPDSTDVCPDKYNPKQEDGDTDKVGDACDNCVAIANTDQKDSNDDGTGDACETPGCGNGVVDDGEQCDDGNKAPGDGCSASCQTELGIAAGGLVITELMANPDAVLDGVGEWLEVYNASGAPVDLAGITVTDGTHTDVIDNDGKPLPLAVGAYAIFAANADPAVNGGLQPDWAWQTLALSNGGATVTMSFLGVTIDAVPYDSGNGGWPGVPKGGSLQLSSDHIDATDNDNGVHWCASTEPYGSGDIKDAGTPGKANAVCTPKPVCGNSKIEVGEECDDGNKDNGDGCSSDCKKEIVAPTLAAGDLIFTEIMANGLGGSSDNGEWIEIKNTTGADIDLTGVVLKYKAVEHVINGGETPVVIKGNSWFVFGRNADVAANGDTPVDYVVKSYQMANTGGSLALVAGGVTVDEVTYAKSAPWPAINQGTSQQLSSDKANATDNDSGASWCVSPAEYGSKGLKGTPGAANAVCGG